MPDHKAEARSAELVNAGWAWKFSLPVALLGLADSIYLTYTHFNGNHLAGCSSTGHINCTRVTTSTYSEIFGHIPVAIVGLVYFALMTLLLTPWAWQMRNEWVHRFRLAATGGAMGMVVYLVLVEVHLKAICEYCTGVHILNFLLFFVVLAAYLYRPISDTPGAAPRRKPGNR